jgi:outer membrane immunogenic protein
MLGGKAFAADMAVKAPPAAPAASWTGFYLGIEGGYGWANGNAAVSGNDPASQGILAGTSFPGGTPLPNPSWHNSGGFGGFEGGYNFQFDRRWVAGIEADISGSTISGTGSVTSLIQSTPFTPVTQTVTTQQSIGWFSTIRPRIGFLATDQLLFYGTAGLAIAGVNESVSYATSTTGGSLVGGFSFRCLFANAPCIHNAGTRTVAGWTAGAGVEYAIDRTLSVKAEYLYVGLPATAVGAVAPVAIGLTTPASFNTSFSRPNFQVVKVGLNWNFRGL